MVFFKDQILELAERECGFLKLSGHSLYNEKGRRKPRQGVTATFRFYIKGLPRVKRAKWHQPLCWSVMAPLQRCGREMKMQGGELYAFLAEDTLLRLDLCITF